MRAIQKRTTIHIIGAIGIDNGDLIWVGKIVGLHFTGGGTFERELVNLITYKLNKKVRGERKSKSFDLIGFYAQINGMLAFFFAIFVLHVLEFNL